jgi:nitroreductase
VGVLDMMRAADAGDVTPSPLLTRRSIRRYQNRTVPEELIQQLLVEARWAPSASNTQSTYVYVLSGEPFKKFKDDLRTFSEDDVPPRSDLDMRPQWTPKLEARMQELMKIRSSWCAEEEKRMGLPVTPPPANLMVAAAEIFKAPVMLVLAFDKAISQYSGCFDAGILALAITLAAHARGLGTCILGGAVRYSELMHKHLPDLEDKNVVAGLALGYPDLEAPINRFPRSRVLLREFVTFVK